jgi:sensor histidine kinase regulating citrate/malate metabolism
VKFDDSTQAYLVQVSVPVKDADKVIGAITVGIDVEKLK